MKMGTEDDDAGSKKIGMIKFDDIAGAGDDAAEDDDDEEDLEGGVSYKGGAEAREKRMREIQELEQSREGSGDVKMEVDEEKPKDGDVEMNDDTSAKPDVKEEEEEEEEDELEAFMNQVNKEVRNVEKEDRRKGNGVNKVNEEVVMKNGEEAGEEEEEVEEENTGMTAKDILA
jgi:ATP-dependent RNA helicase DDX46/PRP5